MGVPPNHPVVMDDQGAILETPWLPPEYLDFTWGVLASHKHRMISRKMQCSICHHAGYHLGLSLYNAIVYIYIYNMPPCTGLYIYNTKLCLGLSTYQSTIWYNMISFGSGVTQSLWISTKLHEHIMFDWMTWLQLCVASPKNRCYNISSRAAQRGLSPTSGWTLPPSVKTAMDTKNRMWRTAC
jgi:hypothetical protein